MTTLLYAQMLSELHCRSVAYFEMTKRRQEIFPKASQQNVQVRLAWRLTISAGFGWGDGHWSKTSVILPPKRGLQNTRTIVHPPQKDVNETWQGKTMRLARIGLTASQSEPLTIVSQGLSKGSA